MDAGHIGSALALAGWLCDAVMYYEHRFFHLDVKDNEHRNTSRFVGAGLPANVPDDHKTLFFNGETWWEARDRLQIECIRAVNQVFRDVFGERLPTKAEYDEIIGATWWDTPTCWQLGIFATYYRAGGAGAVAGTLAECTDETIAGVMRSEYPPHIRREAARLVVERWPEDGEPMKAWAIGAKQEALALLGGASTPSGRIGP